jgi:ABC-type branched-subunit amino acid transport system ATPase component
MLDKVRFENFKILKDVTCDLGQFNVIVGPNASGKTSMLEGMHYLSQLIPKHSINDIDYLFHGSRWFDMLHSGDCNDAMTLACFSNGDEVNFKASKSQVTVDRQKLGDSGWFGGLIGRTSGSVPVSFEPLQDGNRAAKSIKSMAFLHFEASQLAKPSYSEHENPRVEYSGEGLATVIANMKLSAEEDFESLKSMIRRIVPQLENIRVAKRRTNTYRKEVVSIRNENITTRAPHVEMRDALVFDFTNRKGVPANNLSEGTLLALGLLTVLHSPARPRVILLDDIEKGLHPKAQKNLVEMLREILNRQPDLQIIATSHSPYFLDFLQFEEVRLMTVGDDGYSVCGRLENHPKFEKWKDELAPGEMWSLFGEKWMTEKEST